MGISTTFGFFGAVQTPSESLLTMLDHGAADRKRGLLVPKSIKELR